MKKLTFYIATLFFLTNCSRVNNSNDKIPLTNLDLHIKFQDSLMDTSTKKYPNFLFEKYDKILKENPDSANAYYLRGRIDTNKDLRIKYFKNSLKIDSNNYYSLNEIAINLLDSNKIDLAIKLAEKAKDKYPDKINSYYTLQYAFAMLHDKTESNSKRLKYIQKAIENIQILNKLTNNKFQNIYEQYSNIKTSEEQISKYNEAVQNYNNNYKCVGRWIGQLNGMAAWTFELNIYSNGNWLFYSYPYKKQLYGSYEILKSGDYFELNLNTNTDDAEKMVYNGLQKYTVFKCYGSGTSLRLDPRITGASLAFPYENEVTFYKQ